jgi:hypothetical protein
MKRDAHHFIRGAFLDDARMLTDDQKALVYNPMYESCLKKHKMHFFRKLYDYAVLRYATC